MRFPRFLLRPPVRVLASAYSRALDRILLLADTDRALHLLDPATCEDRRIPLPRRGTSLALHADGLRAAVGHDGYLTVVDLRSASAPSTLAVPVPIADLAFDASDRMHAFARTADHFQLPLLSVDTAGVVTRPTAVLDASGRLRMSPDGLSLFWVAGPGTSSQAFARIDPATGAVIANRDGSGTFQVCHELFVTDDSRNVVTGCSAVLGLAPGTEMDLRLVGMLAGPPMQSLQHVQSLAARGLMLAIRAAGVQSTQVNDDSAVQVHDVATWALVRSIPLPTFDLGAQPGTNLQAGHGKAVFIRSDGSKYYALVSISTVGAQGIATLSPDQPAEPVVVRLDPAQPLRPVLRMPPPPTPLAISPVRLEGDVVAVGYSARLDRLVIASRRPTSAVRLIDPDTGCDERLPLPAPPQRLAVREDGVLAAVIHEGGMVVLDLTKGSVLWRAAGSIGQASFGTHPRLLYDPDGVGTWLDLDTGASQSVSIFGTFGEPTRVLRPFAVQPSGTTIYVSGEELVRFDGDPSRQTAALDLRLFQVSYGSNECRQALRMMAGGGSLVLDCGRVLRLSADPAGDLRYVGSLDGLSRVGPVHHSRRLDRFLTLARNYQTPSGLETTDQELWVHEPRHLGLERRLSWKSAGTPAVRGLELFERPSGRLLIFGATETGPIMFAVDP